VIEKKKILIIDDEEDCCFFVKQNLERTGEFEVIIANCGEKGINLAKEKNPDLILLDIIMPDMMGEHVAAELQNDSKTKNIPIVFLTAVITKEEINGDSMKYIGGCFFISKPVDPKELAGSIKKVLSSKGK